ncbi:MAG: sigma-54-dependent Fis family transcriptional regulator [Desulfobulbaceae bacterium]|nr:sigma-54-dependent Fis family transcriptional regulator [Desulfobulbaceae bacterium]
MNEHNLLTRATVLVVDDTPENLALISSLLKDTYKVKVTNNGDKALAIAASDSPPNLILLDIMMPGIDGYEVCRRLKLNPATMHIPVIFLTGRSEVEDEQKGLELGAVDYITKPISPAIVLARVKNHLALKAMADLLRDQNNLLESEVAKRTGQLVVAKEEAEKGKESAEASLAEIKNLQTQLEMERAYLQDEIKLEYNHTKIIGQSDALKYVLYKIEQIASSSTTVLILGETGTGKELIARAVHDLSLRKNRTLVKVNCAALPANLIESELFGHEKGAFTGSQLRHLGRFEIANGGTFFLDEIGELPLELQGKLLRVLQDGEFERLGGSQTIKVDTRIIAATNRDLEEEVRQGRFREDLWYRLNVFPITSPPLRDRREDIPLLVDYYVKKIAKRMGKTIDIIPMLTMEALQQYHWPGNVRELENVLERAVINSSGPKLRLVDELKKPAKDAPASPTKTLAAVEHDYILQVLEQTGWKISGKNSAAEILDLDRSTLRARMNKLNIEKP